MVKEDYDSAQAALKQVQLRNNTLTSTIETQAQELLVMSEQLDEAKDRASIFEDNLKEAKDKLIELGMEKKKLSDKDNKLR